MAKEYSFPEFLAELKRLNPRATIKLEDPRFASTSFDKIYCDRALDSLVLPDGFYYNDKNGITNKHNTPMLYLSIDYEFADKSQQVTENGVPLYDYKAKDKPKSKLIDRMKNSVNNAKENNNVDELGAIKMQQEQVDKSSTTISHPEFDITFESLKNTFDNYGIAKDSNGNYVAIDKNSNTVITDPMIIKRAQFAKTWYYSIAENCSTPNINMTREDMESDPYLYERVFNDGAKETYEFVMNEIQQQMLSTGNVDPGKIADTLAATKAAGRTTYKYEDDALYGMFASDKRAQSVIDWVKSATPDAVSQKQTRKAPQLQR